MTDLLHRREWPAYVALALIALVAGVSHLDRKSLSLFDEVSFIGYVQFVTEGHVARNGDVLPSWAREYVACLPVQPHGLVTTVPCGTTVEDPGRYPFGGTRVGQGWPPGYFAVAAGFVTALMPIGVEPLIAARLASLLLFACGTFLIFWFLRLLYVSRAAAAAVILVLWALPSGDLYSRFVTPHAAVPLLVGAALVVAGLRHRERLGSVTTVGLLVAIGMITALTVPHAVFAIVAVTVATGAHEILRDTRSDRSWMCAVALSVSPLAAIAAYALWMRYHATLVGTFPGVIAPPFEEPMTGEITIRQRLMSYGLYFWPEVVLGDLNISRPTRTVVAEIVALTSFAAIGAVLLRPRGMRLFKLLAAAAIVFGTLAALVFSYRLAYPPMRYGYGFAVIVTLLMAPAFDRRHLRFAFLLCAVAAFVVAMLIPTPAL